MSKLDQLRQAILRSAPIEADQLLTHITNGHCTHTGVGVRYEAEVVVTLIDWPHDIHAIVFALLEWLKHHEPNAPLDALKFEVDIISHQLLDVAFILPYSEVVIKDGNAFTACSCSDYDV